MESKRRYVALLRGINVSGHKIIKMEVLRQYFAMSNFSNIVTYIQSGNVLFDTMMNDEEALKSIIENKLETELGYHVSVILRAQIEFFEIIKNNPFSLLAVEDGRKLSVTFLSGKPLDELVNGLPSKSGESDEIRFVNREAYLLCKAYHETKFSNSFLEKKLSLQATTRNWATVNKLSTL